VCARERRRERRRWRPSAASDPVWVQRAGGSGLRTRCRHRTPTRRTRAPTRCGERSSNVKPRLREAPQPVRSASTSISATSTSPAAPWSDRRSARYARSCRRQPRTRKRCAP
jgi:hypothetical protein